MNPLTTPTIRFVCESDAAELAALYAPYIPTPVTFEYEAPGSEEFAARIREFSSSFPFLVAQSGGEIIGYAYAHRYQERAAYQWSAELSVYVKEGHKRQGIGSVLYRCMFELLKLQRYQTLYARVSTSNPVSVLMHESLGFVQAGVTHDTGYKGGVWHGVHTLEKSIGGHETPPLPILSIHELDPQAVRQVLEAHAQA